MPSTTSQMKKGKKKKKKRKKEKKKNPLKITHQLPKFPDAEMSTVIDETENVPTDFETETATSSDDREFSEAKQKLKSEASRISKEANLRKMQYNMERLLAEDGTSSSLDLMTNRTVDSIDEVRKLRCRSGDKANISDSESNSSNDSSDSSGSSDRDSSDSDGSSDSDISIDSDCSEEDSRKRQERKIERMKFIDGKKIVKFYAPY